MARLDGQRAMVTGAASGIGRAVAVRFAAEGAAVGLLDRNAAGLAETEGAILGAEWAASRSSPAWPGSSS
jgi:NAD(P)-dependent dehydrogenase (short-subunit alcohol dehydrogenase family)